MCVYIYIYIYVYDTNTIRYDNPTCLTHVFFKSGEQYCKLD